MKILLIDPPQPYMLEKHYQVSLGILYLSAIIKRERPDVDVNVLALFDENIEKSIQKIKKYFPLDIIGFTSTTLDYPTVFQIKNKLQNNCDAKFIIGGPHASACADTFNDDWDTVFCGEGEQSIIEFIDDLEISNNMNKIKRHDYIKDLDWLPYPDRDSNPWLHNKDKNKNSLNIVASRGCQWYCTFCASHLTWSRNIRWRTPEAVAREIQYCIDKYGIKLFKFSDENIMTNKEWLQKFCQLIIPLKITWRTIARVDDADPYILDLMCKSGCQDIAYGVESFDKNVLKILNKQIVTEQSIEAIKMSHNAGIGSNLLLMINTPGETYKHTVDTNIEYLEKVRGKFSYVGLKPLIPLPGTSIWNYPERFKITIKTRDFSKFNFWMYYLDKDGNRKPIEKSNIQINGMTEEQQLENLVRMREYVESLNVDIS